MEEEEMPYLVLAVILTSMRGNDRGHFSGLGCYRKSHQELALRVKHLATGAGNSERLQNTSRWQESPKSGVKQQTFPFGMRLDACLFRKDLT